MYNVWHIKHSIYIIDVTFIKGKPFLTQFPKRKKQEETHLASLRSPSILLL